MDKTQLLNVKALVLLAMHQVLCVLLCVLTVLMAKTLYVLVLVRSLEM